MRYSFVAMAACSLAVVSAQPHGHQHQAKHAKRDVVWVTDWVSVTEIVGITTTVWVTPGFVPPVATDASTTAPVATSVKASSTSAPASTFVPPIEQPKPAESSVKPSSQAPVPPPSTTLVPVFKQGVVPEVNPTTSVAPVVAPTTVAPVVQPPVVVAPPVAAPPASAPPAAPPVAPPVVAPPVVAPTVVAPPAATTAPASGGGSSGGSGGSRTGEVTHYTPGLGACGENHTEADHVVALSKDLMGTQSNGNPFCGKSIKVTFEGKTTTALVVDKCMGCTITTIDLSPAAFRDIGDIDRGRLHGATWEFI